jgi:hypothetical protein
MNAWADACDKTKRSQPLGRYLEGKSLAWKWLAFGRPEGKVFPPGMEDLYLEIQRLEDRFMFMSNHRTSETWSSDHMRERTPTIDEALSKI